MTKLKIIRDFIITVILVFIIDFFVSKIFNFEFSIYQGIKTGIVLYTTHYFVTKKKSEKEEEEIDNN